MQRRARLILSAAAGLLGAGTLVVPGATAGAAAGAAAPAVGATTDAVIRVAAEPRPAIAVRRAAAAVELEKYGKRVYLDLGAFLVAGDDPFEVRTVRPSYTERLQSTIILGDRQIRVPSKLVKGFGGATGLVKQVLRDDQGKVVHTAKVSMCTYAEPVRIRPDATDTSDYPAGCYGYNPLSLGSVAGLDAGWGRSLTPRRAGAKIPAGHYTATIRITDPYVELLDLPDTTSRTTIDVTVVDARDCHECEPGHGRTTPSVGDSGVDARPDRSARVLADAPEGVPLPDLRSLPAYGMEMARGHYLAFSATVWNAGPSPLVVDGFRREGEDLMDAYQYFYAPDGTPAGRVNTGTMEWDPREGHLHWHFTDFARYRLLDADGHAVVRSKKEAFCLANTDAIDYTVDGANWNPGNTDLHTACGGYSSIAVREVLDVGSGDTYAQFRPGQSFNLMGLPAGKYFIEVTGNPAGNLAETDESNNTALRPVWITGGKNSEERGFHVKPVGLIDIG
jgi:hypothetical protein